MSCVGHKCITDKEIWDQLIQWNITSKCIRESMHEIRRHLIRGRKTLQTSRDCRQSPYAVCRGAEMKCKLTKKKKYCRMILPPCCSFWLRWFFVHNSSCKGKKRKKKKDAYLVFLPSWAHKTSLTFPSVCRVGFHVCNMLHETKGQMWGNNILFSRGNIPFQCKINISQQLGKKSTLLPSKIKMG